MNKLIVLSDIHANLSALNAVITDFSVKYNPDGIILLGDLINYGMRPNEVIEEIKQLSVTYPILCNIYGNHEKALFYPKEQLTRFSSERGKSILEYTRKKLSAESLEYLSAMMDGRGFKSFEINGKKILCVHGNIEDPYWGKLTGISVENEAYANYDYVFSGHTHLPLHLEVLYKANVLGMRNHKKTVFLNPGSVGQPRNHNPRAQYLYVDLFAEIFHHNSVEYNIAGEQELYTNKTDMFYRNRLSKGI